MQVLFFIISLIVIIAIGIFFYCYPKDYIRITNTIERNGQIILSFYNNSHILNFIVDTGSEISYIDENVIDDIEPKMLYKCDTEIMSITGDTIKFDNKIIFSMLLKKNMFTHCFYVGDISNIVNSSLYDIKIHGIIGNDFMIKYGYIIDYHDMIIYHKNKN